MKKPTITTIHSTIGPTVGGSSSHRKLHRPKKRLVSKPKSSSRSTLTNPIRVHKNSHGKSFEKAFAFASLKNRPTATETESIQFAEASKKKSPPRQRILATKDMDKVHIPHIIAFAMRLMYASTSGSSKIYTYGNIRFRIREIGSGADGTIFSVVFFSPRHMPPVVIKIQKCDDRIYYEMEVEIMQIVSRFAKEGIPHFPILYNDGKAVRDTGTDPYCGFAMELALSDLNSAIKDRRFRGTPRAGIGLLKQVVLTVRYFHEKLSSYWKTAAIHCDLHASNILAFANFDEGYWQYNIDGTSYKVATCGLYFTSYDFARVNNKAQGHCYLTVGYDYLRAFSPHAGVYRSINNIRSDGTVEDKEFIQSMKAACEGILHIISMESHLMNPAQTDNHDWSIGYRLPPHRRPVAPLESSHLCASLMQYLDVCEQGFGLAPLKGSPTRVFTFEGNKTVD